MRGQEGAVGRDPDRLLTAKELAHQLNVPTKKVYELPIVQVRLTTRRIRWKQSDVDAYVSERSQVREYTPPPLVRVPADHPARLGAFSVARATRHLHAVK